MLGTFEGLGYYEGAFQMLKMNSIRIKETEKTEQG